MISLPPLIFLSLSNKHLHLILPLCPDGMMSANYMCICANGLYTRGNDLTKLSICIVTCTSFTASLLHMSSAAKACCTFVAPTVHCTHVEAPACHILLQKQSVILSCSNSLLQFCISTCLLHADRLEITVLVGWE